MASVLKVDKLDPQSGTALEIGTSGDTVTVPSGVGLTLTDSTLLLPTTITSTTEVKTNKISPATGTAFALGDSGDTFTVPSGATIVNSGTATGFGGANTPAFFVKKNAEQTVTNLTWTLVSYQTETLDTDSAFDTSTFKFTPQTAGWYFLFASISWNNSTDFDVSYIGINKNGTGDDAISTAIVDNVYYNTLKTSVLAEANGSSDYFSVSCYHGRGSDIDITSDSTRCYFSGYKIIGA